MLKTVKIFVCLHLYTVLDTRDSTYSLLPLKILWALLHGLLELDVAIGVSRVTFIFLLVIDLLLFPDSSRGSSPYPLG
jgi:hypothetical protein